VTYAYCVVGAGRQGIAASYDLLMRGNAARIVLADSDPAAATRAAETLQPLGNGAVIEPAVVDAADRRATTALLEGFDAALGSASWRLNEGLTDAAIDAGTHLVDLGGNAEVVWAQLARDQAAQDRGVTVVPDCGQVPGTGANLLAYVVRSFDVADTVTLYDGGIPENPTEPWRYELAFSMDGLTNEYCGRGRYLVDGQAKAVEVFDPDEYELIEFEDVGMLEAFATAGGLTTLSQTLAGQVRTLKNKTLRYPGHAAQFRAFRDAGFFGEDPIEVDGNWVVPRSVFHTLIEPRIRAGDAYRDIVINRVVGFGEIAGARTEIVLDVVNHRPEGLPFTAMQAATGWHAAVVMQRLARGECRPGVVEVENAIEGSDLLAELRARDFQVRETRRSLEPLDN
jgi:lysine 6-dehydrogenase